MTYISKPPVPGSPRDQRWKDFNTTIMRSGPIYSNVGYAVNVANTETTLVSNTVNPNIIKRNGDMLLFSGAGELTTTISTKRLRMYVQTTGTLWTPFDFTFPALSQWWWINVKGVMTASTASLYSMPLYVEVGYGATPIIVSRVSMDIDPRDPFECYLTGYSTVGNDIRVDYWSCDFIRGQGLQSG